jgi:ABC-type cobalamin/Fe3+-siderophores transport system ATPase subunit
MINMGRCPYIGMGRLPKKDDLSAAEEAMSRLGLEHLAERSCNSLSGGELQMTLIDTRTAITEKNIMEYFGVFSEIVEMESALRTIQAVVPTEIAGSEKSISTKECIYEKSVS